MVDSGRMFWRIGDVTVTKIVEFENTIPVDLLLAGVDPNLIEADRDWLAPAFIDDAGQLRLSVHTFGVEAGGQRIVVDTCVGNGKKFPRSLGVFANLNTRFLDHLRSAGFAPETVDVVICTHLHFDHVGWNTIPVEGRWVPAFPNARYLFSDADLRYWSANGRTIHTDSFQQGVAPIMAAGLGQAVPSDHRVNDQVWLEPTPGHSPGHVSVHIADAGHHAVITGDMMHSPIQIARPECCSVADYDPDQARQTRHRFLARTADAGALVLGTHFGGPTGGHVLRTGGRWMLKT